MSKESRTVKVKEAADLCCYKVESWGQQSMEHTVNLLSLHGNGACTCTDFGVRCMANHKLNPARIVEYGTTEKKNPDRTRCRHLAAAVRYFANKTLKAMSDQTDL